MLTLKEAQRLLKAKKEEYEMVRKSIVSDFKANRLEDIDTKVDNLKAIRIEMERIENGTFRM